MARNLISGNDVVSFNPVDGTIVANGYIPLPKLLLINNATKNIAIFNFSDSNTLASVTYNPSNNTTLIDLSYDTSLMNSSDEIQIYYEKEELEIKPARTYRDPVSKFRVSNPQTLIDTDFEYGSQPTKWETVKLINNIPTSYSSIFTENSISIESILITENNNIMTVNTIDPHNLPIGGVVEIIGLSDPQYEGTFIVKTSSVNNFSVKLPFNASKSGNLSTIYSTAYKGAFYTGSLVPINDVTTSTGAASTLSITTPNVHGLNNGTKLYLKNSRATKKYSFFIPGDVIGSGTTSYKSEISGLGGTPEPEYYSKNKIIFEEFLGDSEINIPNTNINTSNGEIEFDVNNQFGEIVNSGISSDDVLVYYTPAGNNPITRPGSPSPTNISNFTPFRVLSSNSESGITTFKINDSFGTSLELILDGDGSVLFGNHRFIRGHRIVEFVYPNTLKFDKEIDFTRGDKIIINTNYTTSTYDSYTRSYLTRYNGEYTNPYYVYNVDTISQDKLSITLSAPQGTPNPQFSTINVKSALPDNIWSASKIKDHPLANSLYLDSSVGFSTDLYDDYQFVLYNSLSNATRIPSLSENTNYILQQVSGKPDWYRIYNAQNNNDSTANWNTPINLYYNSSGLNGIPSSVLPVGIHTITALRKLKNSNTISIPDRGGLENNANVIYNSNVNEIGNLTSNETYRIKTEDSSLDADKFRVSKSTNFVKMYGFYYPENNNYADLYIYDTEDRVGFDANAENGIKSAGIIGGNVIQVSGCTYSNPVKRNFINNSFTIQSVTNYTSVPKLDSNSPANTRRYIYQVRVDIPTDGTFNTKTTINTNVTNNLSALEQVKVTSIIELDTTAPGINGEHIFTQNVDGAVDDIYLVENSSINNFVFNTSAEIPQITKNISKFSSSFGSNIDFNTVNPRLSVTNNNTPSNTVTFNYANTNQWVSATTSITYQEPVSVSFNLSNAQCYCFSVGLTELSSTLTNLNYSQGYTIFQLSGQYGNYRQVYKSGIGVGARDNDLSTTALYKILYDSDGYIRYYKDNVEIDNVFIGTGKSLRPFVSVYDFYAGGMSASNIVTGDSGLPFTENVTNYLKIASHNFSDGAEVTYEVDPPSSTPLEPLTNNGKYYVRVLDGNFVGLTDSVEDALDRTQPLIGFTTTGDQTAAHKLITNSVKGYLPGGGSIGISTVSDLVNGNGTNFLTDFTNGDTFRVYNLGNNSPGDYFESKISSIKSDNVLKLENIPTFESSSASYFRETGLYVISDGKVVHRPFDGGVSMYSGLLPNSKVIRQTRRYFRYQSGKGIQVSMAINFNPTYDIENVTKVGSGSTSYFNIKSKYSHKISPNAPESNQRIIISDVVGASSTFFNRESTENGFKIISINDDFNFTVDIENPISTDDISGFPKFSIKNWQDCSLKSGLFDDQNGYFFEYDGVNLYAVRRSSTQQLSGRFTAERNSHLVYGIDSKLTSQVTNNDYIVIRGQTYKVITVVNDNTLSIQPAYRGGSTQNVIISKTIDTKIPQSQWNLDRMDGTGNSGYKIDITKIQMMYLDYSWYGAGSGRLGFKNQYGEVVYAHEFIHNNLFTEAYFRSGNLPARYEVETFDFPLYSPSLSHWGVSVIMDGKYDDDKAYLFTAESDTLPFTNDGYSSTFTGRVTAGSNLITDITAAEYSQLVVGEELVQANYTNIEQGTKILSLQTDTNNRISGVSQRYKIKISTPAISGNNTNISMNAFSGTSAMLQSLIPLVTIRLSPAVDNGNIGNLGFRDIINRMQLTLKSAGVLTTHDCLVHLILNGKLSNESFERVTSPSLSQIYKHEIGDTISEGITVFAFRAQGGDLLVPSTTSGQIGRRSLSRTEVSLDELALLGNSILGGDGTFPDGPDILTLAVKPIDTSTISGGSPMIINGRITWTEAQA